MTNPINLMINIRSLRKHSQKLTVEQLCHIFDDLNEIVKERRKKYDFLVKVRRKIIMLDINPEELIEEVRLRESSNQ